jgi:hypothetical protein
MKILEEIIIWGSRHLNCNIINLRGILWTQWKLQGGASNLVWGKLGKDLPVESTYIYSNSEPEKKFLRFCDRQAWKNLFITEQLNVLCSSHNLILRDQSIVPLTTDGQGKTQLPLQCLYMLHNNSFCSNTQHFNNKDTVLMPLLSSIFQAPHTTCFSLLLNPAY